MVTPINNKPTQQVDGLLLNQLAETNEEIKTVQEQLRTGAENETTLERLKRLQQKGSTIISRMTSERSFGSHEHPRTEGTSNLNEFQDAKKELKKFQENHEGQDLTEDQKQEEEFLKQNVEETGKWSGV